MQLTVLTNGTAFTQSDLEASARLKPARVAVSVYGATPEAHERVTGVPGSFERAMSDGPRRCGLSASAARFTGSSSRRTARSSPRSRILQKSSAATGASIRPWYPPRAAAGTSSTTASRSSSCRILLPPQDGGADEGVCGQSRDGPNARRRAANCGAGFGIGLHLERRWGLRLHGFPAGVRQHRPCSRSRRCGAVPRRRLIGSACASRWRPATRASLLRFCTVRCPRLAAVEDGDLSGPSARACELAGMVRDWREDLQQRAEMILILRSNREVFSEERYEKPGIETRIGVRRRWPLVARSMSPPTTRTAIR